MRPFSLVQVLQDLANYITQGPTMQKKGTPVRPVRIPDGLVELVDQAVARRNLWRRRSWMTRFRGEWTRSSFIVVAIREKLAKMERSRRRPGGRLPSSSA